ncbi:Gfo/Idh/MocA family oxidoreductase [Planctomycetota bacterium]|nr:Gfo/Idh/MocA family oxidoreductase [Planctomycetota bacterium]
MGKTTKIGMIGLDTSHVTCFAELLMNPNDENHIAGCEVVAGWPGGSEDFPMSVSRVDGYTSKLKDHYKVSILNTPEEVAEMCDVVFINAVDGRVHQELFKKIAHFKKPTFIDKPLACDVSEAEEIIATSKANNVTLASCSSLRFVDEYQAALKDDSQGRIISIEAWGPLSFKTPIQGYYWYGIHAIDMIVAGMGAGCISAKATVGEQSEVVQYEWIDGRNAIYHGLKAGQSTFGAVIHREQGKQMVDVSKAKRPFYACLLDELLKTLPFNKTPICEVEMLETIRLIELANASRELACKSI